MASLYELVFELGRRWRTDPMNYELARDYLAVLVRYRDRESVPDGNAGLLNFCRELDGQMPAIIKTLDAETANEFVRLHRDTLNTVATFDFDSYCRFIEWNRPTEQQFYMPRRKQLLPVVEQLQRLADGEIDLLTISMPPGVGKTTLALFFLTFIGGREPNKPNLTCSHSNSFLEGVYRELLRIMDPDGEYLYARVFPASPVTSTNAANLRIDLDKQQRFETFEFTSPGSNNSGKIRAENLLYCDDLVSGLEVALSPDRLEKLWQTYVTDFRQRKKSNARELHIATRWSVHDPIGHLVEQYEGNDRAVFISLPALDENEESNFVYKYGVGFTTEYYLEQRKIMCDSGDEASWRALFQNEPIEREGQLYPIDELRSFLDIPTTESGEFPPDMICAVCDTKNKGKDYCFLPIAFVYGSDAYIVDCVCDNGKPEVVEEKMAQMLVKYDVQLAQFESNNAGYKIAEGVQKRVKELGGRCKITTRPTTQNKETKILAESPYVKEHFLFMDRSLKRSTDYNVMMLQLTRYTLVGNNPHDDVPDGMAQLSQYLQSFTRHKARVFERPF